MSFVEEKKTIVPPTKKYPTRNDFRVVIENDKSTNSPYFFSLTSTDYRYRVPEQIMILTKCKTDGEYKYHYITFLEEMNREGPHIDGAILIVDRPENEYYVYSEDMDLYMSGESKYVIPSLVVSVCPHGMKKHKLRPFNYDQNPEQTVRTHGTYIELDKEEDDLEKRTEICIKAWHTLLSQMLKRKNIVPQDFEIVWDCEKGFDFDIHSIIDDPDYVHDNINLIERHKSGKYKKMLINRSGYWYEEHEKQMKIWKDMLAKYNPLSHGRERNRYLISFLENAENFHKRYFIEFLQQMEDRTKSKEQKDVENALKAENEKLKKKQGELEKELSIARGNISLLTEANQDLASLQNKYDILVESIEQDKNDVADFIFA